MCLRLKPATYAAGTYIYTTGEIGRDLLVVVKGEVSQWRRTQPSSLFLHLLPRAVLSNIRALSVAESDLLVPFLNPLSCTRQICNIELRVLRESPAGGGAGPGEALRDQNC